MKKFHAVLILMLFTISFTEAEAQDQAIRPFFTALIVSNIDSSINWYTRVLHVKLRNRNDNPERGFKQANLTGKGMMIELVELINTISADSLLKSQPAGTRMLGYYKFGFTVKQIDSLFESFTSMDVTFHGRMVTDPQNNKKTFIIKDPDGNRVQFFEE